MAAFHPSTPPRTPPALALSKEKTIVTPRLRLVPILPRHHSGSESELDELQAALTWFSHTHPDLVSSPSQTSDTARHWVMKKQGGCDQEFIGIVQLMHPSTSVTNASIFNSQTLQSNAAINETVSSVLESETSPHFKLHYNLHYETPPSPALPADTIDADTPNTDTDTDINTDTQYLKVNIDPIHAGHGYSTETVKAILSYIFGISNTGAEAVLERVGFQVAEQVSPSMRRDGSIVEGWTVWEIEKDGFMELWAS
ncbi:hypothetical protein HDU99_000384 [Rhizoclosmatium hyalinum]|nr:hypothetical protein HDU99_000384 [Rhizoclosmatium hyalinum]